MIKKIIALLLSFNFLVIFSLIAQTVPLDSLKLELKKASNDTSRCNILHKLIETEFDASKWPTYNTELKKLAELNIAKNPETKIKNIFLKHYCFALSNTADLEAGNGKSDEALQHYNEALKIYTELNDKAGMGDMYNNLGQFYCNINQFPLSFEYYEKSMEIRKARNDVFGMAAVFNNLGVSCYRQGDIPKALEYYESSLKKMEELNDKRSASMLLFNIGTIYIMQGEYEQALSYSERCLAIRKEVGDKGGAAEAYENISAIYNDKKEADKSTKAMEMAMELYREIGDRRGISNALNGLGTNSLKRGENEAALKYYTESLKIRETLNRKELVAFSLNNIGLTYFNLKKYDKALEFCSRGLKLAQEIGIPETIRDASKFLTKIYKAQNNYPKAFEMLELTTKMRDSLTNESNRKASIRSALNYEFEKKEAIAKAEQDKKDTLATAEKNKQRLITYVIGAGLLAVVLLALFIYRSYRQKQKANIIITLQKEEVEIQKLVIEEKNKDIFDSITYAKRIQQAKLPKKEDITAAFAQNFILFKPKDIVSGDFYFFHKSPSSVFIAAADCTGHGVPGALMSMIGSEQLNDAVSKSQDTSVILQLLNRGIKTSLRQSENDTSTRDGMDIALCAIDVNNCTVKYAGANRPLWIVRKGIDELEEIKATKKAIGGLTENKQYFDSHEIKLSKGDTIYICTDGYADQFSGINGKKLMTKKLKEILVDIQHKSMPEQESHLDHFIEQWRSGTEQVDDILVIGIRF
ncbi:MAG TPA: tetratricopeptide repeat protein [Bacteroidia bacterium]|jgi:tetratricopeptide (TPR) repeat protein/serine phosphatase RsbU (regulator of sigma subunit)